MFKVILAIAVILLIVFIIALILVGLCIGMAYLIIFFIPSINWISALVPAAILTVVPMFILVTMLNTLKLPSFAADQDEEDSPKIPPYRPRRSKR